MFFIADLHTHSHYAGGTSPALCLETMHQWALIKGIDVVGTGDFTHPAWCKELEEKLQPAGNGFFTLKKEPAPTELPGITTQHRIVYYCLSTEVSCEYNIQGKQYKNHHLLYAPDFDTVHHINKALAPYGDLALDGRPTLRLQAHELLKIILESTPAAHFVPAHVWTPWYSTLGAMNGHSSLQDCFKDVTRELFAVETSLSADPLMCRRYSGLDHLTLLSNSDAHSASKLGREVNLFDTELSYDAMFNVIKTRQGFSGTWEYFPQRGKYFNNGHRNCKVSIDPGAGAATICPRCKKPLTIGVGHRVEQLADRSLSEAASLHQPFQYIIPLQEILSEIMDCGEQTKTVEKKYVQAISYFGNEFDLLLKVPLEDIHRFHPILSEAIRRLRNNQKHFTAGFDGEYGEIRFFDEGELNRKPAQMELF